MFVTNRHLCACTSDAGASEDKTDPQRVLAFERRIDLDSVPNTDDGAAMSRVIRGTLAAAAESPWRIPAGVAGHLDSDYFALWLYERIDAGQRARKVGTISKVSEGFAATPAVLGATIEQVLMLNLPRLALRFGLDLVNAVRLRRFVVDALWAERAVPG
jgi:hypothetical protein